MSCCAGLLFVLSLSSTMVRCRYACRWGCQARSGMRNSSSALAFKVHCLLNCRCADVETRSQDDGPMQLPPSLALSSEKLDQDAVLLLENGEDAIIWVGRGAAPESLSSLFGVKSFEELASGPVRAPQYCVLAVLRVCSTVYLQYRAFALLCVCTTVQ